MKTALLILAFIGFAVCAPRLDPLVKTEKGLVRGVHAPDGDYAMFLGVPYARINQSNPFGRSQAYPDFEDVFEANDDSIPCPQLDELVNELTGSLDCLNLNIFVPNKATSENRLPVMVWIHGGGFRYGSGNRALYGPKFLMRKDVVLVTVNYRLGFYGFMCLDTADVPGNEGLRDQLAALRWIKNNIGSFGGDASQVTVFGESAGAASIDFHMLSDHEKLFKRAILQSGTALSPWATVEADRSIPVKVAEHLGFTRTESLDETLEFLATVEPLVVIAAVKDLAIKVWPCVEKEFDGVERIVSEYPINMAVPKENMVPVLAGYNSNEMLWTYGHKPAESYQDSNVFQEKVAEAFHLKEDGELEMTMQKYYIGDDEPSIDLKQNLINFESDSWFNYPIHMYVQRYVANAGHIRHYIFSHDGPRNLVKYQFNITGEGAAHADELSYLFDPQRYITEEPTEGDQIMIEKMTTMWSNFAKYGDPTPETSDLLRVKWDHVNKEHMTYLDINSDMSLKRRPFHDRIAFWELFYRVFEDYIIGYKGGKE